MSRPLVLAGVLLAGLLVAVLALAASAGAEVERNLAFPFTGWATFTRRGNGRPGTWEGPLGMPILGGDPVKLAGREFRAAIHKGVQQPR